ncbi:hypothetical protein W03_24520 [Nitrosomonas sp. PY1]|nr:hypothetical protein W03_24520 [Nitrosomonas sp. PY1]
MRRRVWNEAKRQQFSSFDDLNEWLEMRCRALWSEIQHPDYSGITLAEALEQEQLYMMPMPAPFDGYVEVLARLKHTDVPASVETTLKLKEEPQADTARYDCLNKQEVPHV